MAISVSESDLRAFRKSNPAGILKYLFSVDRIHFNTATKLYDLDHKTSFDLVLNDNSRLFSKDYLSKSVAIIDFMKGDVDKLIPKLVSAISIMNSACIFLPTSSSPKSSPKQKKVDKELSAKFSEVFPLKLKQSALEWDYPNTLTPFIFVSNQCPYFESFSQLCTN